MVKKINQEIVAIVNIVEKINREVVDIVENIQIPQNRLYSTREVEQYECCVCFGAFCLNMHKCWSRFASRTPLNHWRQCVDLSYAMPISPSICGSMKPPTTWNTSDMCEPMFSQRSQSVVFGLAYLTSPPCFNWVGCSFWFFVRCFALHPPQFNASSRISNFPRISRQQVCYAHRTPHLKWSFGVWRQPPLNSLNFP